MRRLQRRPLADIEAVDWFVGLTETELRTVARHVEWCELEAGERVLARGQSTAGAWVPVVATLEARLGDAVLDVIKPPFAAGEIELNLRAPVTADVVAPGPGLAIWVPASTYAGMLLSRGFVAATVRRLAVLAAQQRAHVATLEPVSRCG